MMNTTIPAPVFTMLCLLEEAGYEAWLVGGCVRDMLMEKTCHDYDMTTNATPEAMQTLFTAHGYRLILTGIRHGTLIVLDKASGMQVEITTYRSESGYADHRTPKVRFIGNLQADLQRRDLTINAMAWHPRLGLRDYFGGQSDIKQRCIRCVGDPKQRFHEDALRMLRAVRFALQLRFTLEPKTLQALRQQAAALSFLSRERIRQEWERILRADASHTLQILRDTKLLEHILPGYDILYDHPQPTPWHCYDVFTHTDKALDHTKQKPLIVKLAVVLHDIGKPSCESFDTQGIAHYKGHAKRSADMARQLLQNLAYDRHTIDMVYQLIYYHDTRMHCTRHELYRFLGYFHHDFKLAKAALHIQIADNMAKNPHLVKNELETLQDCLQLLAHMEAENDTFPMRKLAINGHDVKAIGWKKEQIKAALQWAYDAVLDEKLPNDKTILLNALKQRR